jgi:signal transduction histidine kinase
MLDQENRNNGADDMNILERGGVGPVKLWRSFWLFFSGIVLGKWKRDLGERRSPARYIRLWRFTVLITTGACLTPLLIIGALDFYQDQQAIKAETIRPLVRLISNTERSMEFFLEEHTAALNFIINDNTVENLSDQGKLALIFKNLKQSFGGYVDLGLIDLTGKQVSYVGPYDLLGKNYRGQDWFHEVSIRGIYVSDVFMGYRNLPHFVIAVKYEKDDGGFHILRATIDTQALNQQILALGLRGSSDAFVMNREGKLQTPSLFYGDILKDAPIPVPPYSESPEVMENYYVAGERYILSYAYIDHSPFIVVVMKKPEDLMGNWFTLRSKRLGFLAASVIVVVVLIMGTSSYLVSRIREADLRQARILHNIQYTNKMASIGRLAAGVAHEVNNPLAIINEKAGLAKDIIALENTFPQREKFLNLINSIQSSVERCSTITHRLLGFAKRLDIQIERINLEELIREVLGFLEKEANYRNITINVNASDGFVSVESDRGQLQQVFLNLINNAIEELEKGGMVDIGIQRQEDGFVAVTITDNGRGIPEENLKQIFEPFFTTKKEYGTGLGLSITYGIVEKLGGNIDVKSKAGVGTSFIVTLPVKAPMA